MMDSSWGSSAQPAFTGSRDEREQQRAEARERRAAERIAAAEARTAARATTRDTQSQVREHLREQRRTEEQQRRAAAADARDARPKRRSTGSLARTGHATEERDTRHYATALDLDRLRLLARRGATPAALAHAFKISEAEVAAALAQ